jgi:hypothetical protein
LAPFPRHTLVSVGGVLAAIGRLETLADAREQLTPFAE